jgi:hypothetical protein
MGAHSSDWKITTYTRWKFIPIFIITDYYVIFRRNGLILCAVFLYLSQTTWLILVIYHITFHGQPADSQRIWRPGSDTFNIGYSVRASFCIPVTHSQDSLFLLGKEKDRGNRPIVTQFDSATVYPGSYRGGCNFTFCRKAKHVSTIG